MQMKYGELAKQNHVYVVGACGWDSIPCDLGTNYLKQNFKGTLCYAETFAQIKMGQAVSRSIIFLKESLGLLI